MEWNGMELCLCVYSINDFKLEAVCSNDNAEQFWFEINNQFRDAGILLSKNTAGHFEQNQGYVRHKQIERGITHGRNNKRTST